MIPVQSLATDILVALACIVGDHLLEEPDISRYPWSRALVDSSTHGAVGLLSWMVVVGPDCRQMTMIEIFLCGVIASAVDVDHFIAARSFRIKDAVSLPDRPPFHNSSLIPFGMLLLYILPRMCQVPYLLTPRLYLIFLVAVTSHHIRDATRRGLWFWPFGSTPPLPRWLYVGSIMVLPFIIRLFIYTNNVTERTVTATPHKLADDLYSDV